MSLFGNARKVLGQAQRYAQQNPDKIRGLTDKAAQFADKRTKGKYHSQIDDVVRKVDGITGGDPRGGHQDPPSSGSPDPRRDDRQDPYRP